MIPDKVKKNLFLWLQSIILKPTKHKIFFQKSMTNVKLTLTLTPQQTCFQEGKSRDPGNKGDSLAYLLLLKSTPFFCESYLTHCWRVHVNMKRKIIKKKQSTHISALLRRLFLDETGVLFTFTPDIACSVLVYSVKWSFCCLRFSKFPGVTGLLFPSFCICLFGDSVVSSLAGWFSLLLQVFTFSDLKINFAIRPYNRDSQDEIGITNKVLMFQVNENLGNRKKKRERAGSQMLSFAGCKKLRKEMKWRIWSKSYACTL